MTYTKTVESTRRALEEYRQNLGQHGKAALGTKKSRGVALQKILNYIQEYDRTIGPPIRIADIISELGTKYEKTVYSLLHNYVGLLHEVLVNSGVWERQDGEPIVTKNSPNGTKYMTSERYPNVVLSHHSKMPDIALIPTIKPRGPVSAELGGSLYVSCYASQESKLAEELGIVDFLSKKMKPYEAVYIQRHLIQLFSDLFGIPTRRFSYIDATRNGGYSQNIYIPQIQIESPMIGSYFQDVEAIFEVKNSRVERTNPELGTDERKKAFIRGATDDIANIKKTAVHFKDNDEEILCTLRDIIQAIGFEATDVKPHLSESYRLRPIDMYRDKIKGIANTQAPVGKKVYERLSNGKVKKIGVIIDHIKEERYEREGIPDFIVVKLDDVIYGNIPRGDIFQEAQYYFYVQGGMEAVTDFMDTIMPRNPVRMIQFMRALGIIIPHPTPQNPLHELQEELYERDLCPSAIYQHCLKRDAIKKQGWQGRIKKPIIHHEEILTSL